MSALDVLAFAGRALAGHRLRTGLSLLGVAIGVAAVVLLTSLGEGARRYVRQQFESLGTNLLIVLPGKVETAGAMPGFGGVPNDLTLQDAEVVKRSLPQAQHVVPIALGNETLGHRERRRQVIVIGTTPGFLEARKLSLSAGQFLPDVEWTRSSPAVVLGHSLAEELFPAQNPLGEVVRLGEWRLRVVGVLDSFGTQMAMDVDEIAIVPVQTAMRMFNRSSLFRLLVSVRAPSEIEDAKRRTLAVLTERHGEEDVTLITQDSVSGAFFAILTVLTLALSGIAAISLSVAGIGIMNVMLVSVSERTAEVGLLRALGARRPQVLAVFLCEAVLLSGMGGAVGLLLSWVATRVLVAWYPAFPAGAPAWAVVAAIGVSVLVGTVFGVHPAMQATRLDPVEALAGS